MVFDLETTAVKSVSLADIALDDKGFEVRLDYDVDSLMDSLGRDGQFIPVTLRGEAPSLQIICGFRRIHALQKLGAEDGKDLGDIMVLAFVHPDLASEKAWRLAWLENEERQATNPVEKASFIKKMMDSGLQPKQIQDQLSITERTYQRYNLVSKMGYQLTRLLVIGEIGLRHALALHIHRGDIEDLASWIDRITGEEKLSAEKLEKALSNLSGGDKKVFELHVPKDRASFRVPSFSYTDQTSDEERDQMVAVLREAIQYLEDPSSLARDTEGDAQVASAA